MCVLPECVYVHCVCTWCPWGPEDRIRPPKTRAMHDCEMPTVWVPGTEPGPLQAGLYPKHVLPLPQLLSTLPPTTLFILMF